jgi:hypothetical protein
MPVSLYLQATVQYAIRMRKRTNKPFFLFFRPRQRLGIPPEKLFAPAAEHETTRGGLQRKKKSLN